MPAAADRATAAFRAGFHRNPTLLARAPGRVNLIGEHVDYSDGFVLPLAIDRDFVVVAAAGHGGLIRVRAADLGEEDAFDPALPFELVPGWRSYVRGVAAVLVEDGVSVGAADLVLAGDVPKGAGLSSSAALEVACARALLALAGAELAELSLAQACRRAEVDKVGVACGIMDQCAAILGKAGHAILLDCRSLEYQLIPMPGGAALVVSDTGTRRSLQASAFNERFAECREASARLGVPALRDVPVQGSEPRLRELPEPLRRRARHVIHEIERTVQAAAALERGDLAAVGRHMNASHQGLRDEYEVSTWELDALVSAALVVDGVYGSRMCGAGFGGCTLSLVAETAVADFLAQVPAAYHHVTGREAASYVCRPSDGATVRWL